jgi:hypothetical protein
MLATLLIIAELCPGVRDVTVKRLIGTVTESTLVILLRRCRDLAYTVRVRDGPGHNRCGEGYVFASSQELQKLAINLTR